MEICDRDAVNLEVRQSDGQVFLGHWHHAAPCTTYALHAYLHAPADVSYSQMLKKSKTQQPRCNVSPFLQCTMGIGVPQNRCRDTSLFGCEDEHNVCVREMERVRGRLHVR